MIASAVFDGIRRTIAFLVVRSTMVKGHYHPLFFHQEPYQSPSVQTPHDH